MKFKNYIWDFDGTICDSYPHTCEVFWQILCEEGLDVRCTKDEIMRHLLVTFSDAREFSGISDEGYKKFLHLTHLIGDEELEPKVVPFADCESVLRAVVGNGGRNFLYTHRNFTAKWFLDEWGYSKYFTDMLMEEENFPLKPAPDALLALIGRNSLKPEESIMIGDREIDGLSGHNAKIVGALVNYPDALPDGRDPASVSEMEYTARSLTEFARLMGIF